VTARVNNIQAMEARYQGFWKASVMVSPLGWCLVVMQPRFLKESLIQNTYRSFMGSTIKARDPMFVCLFNFFFLTFVINQQALYRMNYQVIFHLETKANMLAYNCLYTQKSLSLQLQ